MVPKKEKLGYLTVHLRKNDGTLGKHRKVHRLVAEAFLENPENKPQVNHIDGNKENNNVENLEWVTASENIIHAVSKKLRVAAKGECHSQAKLNEESVIEIKRRYSLRGISQKKLGEIYNVSQSQISRIIRNERWNK